MASKGEKGNKTNIFKQDIPMIFKNLEVMSPQYVPDTLVARDNVITEVRNALSPILIGGYPRHLVFQGKSGTGKTVVINYVVNQLLEYLKEENADDRKINSDILYVEINCEERNTTIRVIYDIIQKIDDTIEIPVVGMATSWYFDRLWDVINTHHVSLFIILDEIDKMDANNLLYNLSRAQNRKIDKGLFIGIVAITNNTRYLTEGRIDARVLSSLNPLSIVFSPYDADMLREILEQRAVDAFVPGVLDDLVIPLCAARGANEHGDARLSLSLLETAGHVAIQHNVKKVLEEHVKEAEKKNEVNAMIDVLKKQPFQSKLLLLCVIYQWQLREPEENYLRTGDVYEQYKLFSMELEKEVLGPTRISGLLSELDYLNVIDAPVDSSGERGRTRKIMISIPVREIIENIIIDDDLLRNIVEKVWGKTITDNPIKIPNLYYSSKKKRGKQTHIH